MRGLQRKKVGLLYAGAMPTAPASFQKWLGGLPELGIIADIIPLAVRKSADVGGSNFTQVAATIVRQYPSVDGFVIMRGSDDLLYLAAALSFSLTGLGKPVVVVGAEISAQRPGELSSGLKADLINAVQAATLAFSEVGIMSGNRLLRGNAAIRARSAEAGSFEAPPGAVLGRIDFSIRLLERTLRPTPRTRLVVTPLERRVDYVVLTPWHGTEALQRHAANAAALLLNTRTQSVLPSWLQLWLQTAAERKPVAVLTAASSVVVKSNTVAVLPAGTPEAMLAKLAWAAAMAKTPAKVSVLMAQEVAGEFSV